MQNFDIVFQKLISFKFQQDCDFVVQIARLISAFLGEANYYSDFFYYKKHPILSKVAYILYPR